MTGSIERHYARKDLGERILKALRAAGKDVDNLTPLDLAPIDTLHNRGREATAELAAMVEPARDWHVLDIGCGLGGPSRFLAAEYGCRVIGVDLTEEYCRAAAMLAKRIGIANRVEYRCADACDLPFDDAAFDAVWTEHAAMNIEDKVSLYAEMFRVLKPAGRLAIYDVVKGPGGPVKFPVPWASDESISFLMTPEEMRETLEGAGFCVLEWRDVTQAMIVFARRMAEKAAARPKGKSPRPAGVEVVGLDTSKMVKNHLDGRTALVMAMLERPA